LVEQGISQQYGEKHSGEEATHFNSRSAYLVGNSYFWFPTSSFLRLSFSPGILSFFLSFFFRFF